MSGAAFVIPREEQHRIEQAFYPLVMAGEPEKRWQNEDRPKAYWPPLDMGRILVIVRLVDRRDGVHYRPAIARRWTRNHVMVWIPGAGEDARSEITWLHRTDVLRLLHERTLDEPFPPDPSGGKAVGPALRPPNR